MTGLTRERFSEGRSPHFFVEDRPGLMLILYRGEVELRRHLLALEPYTANTVQL